MENSRSRLGRIDIDQLRHIQEELTRLRNDLDEKSRVYRDLESAITQIERAIEASSRMPAEDGFVDATDFPIKDDSENG